MAATSEQYRQDQNTRALARIVPDQLTTVQRIIGATVGIVLGGLGVAAVFMTENAAGSVALLALGGLFGCCH